MPTQRLNTGRSAQFLDTGGGGGISLAEAMLTKSFFAHNGLLPANTVIEALYDFPAPSFTFGTTLTTNMGSTKASATNPSNFGYNLGGSFDKCLIIVGLTRPESFAGGIFIGQATPIDGNPPQGYIGTADYFFGGPSLQKSAGGGTNTHLATDTSITYAGTPGPNIGQALYHNRLTNRIVYWQRFGYEQWIAILDITDASFASPLTTAGIVQFTSSVPSWYGCPIGVYVE